MEARQKGDREKAVARTALEVQEVLFNIHKKGDSESVFQGDGRACLLLAARKGLLQLTHLLLQENPQLVDEVLEDACGTTALHQAASHGQDGCVALLVNAGANKQKCDTYGQTPGVLAAMSGHKSTVELLGELDQDVQELPCSARTTAKEATQGFKAYVKLHEKKYCKYVTPYDRHHPDHLTRRILKGIELRTLDQEAQRVFIDLSRGEALEIRDVVMAEMKAIMDKVSAVNPTYRGDLRLAGSSQDGSKLYAPDEFDINIVIQQEGVRPKLNERREVEAALKGSLELSVDTDNPHLQGNNFMANLYEEVHRCLANHTLQDKRLSLVPPALTSTQVGVALALAWWGQEYPLLLVGVDLVPVLEVPWPEQIPRPFLTPADTNTIQISNAADGTWRCSFAVTEAQVLETLNPEELMVFLTGKVILSCLKAERWMSRHKKNFYTWYDTRDYKIPVPSGFCLKNAFLRRLERRRREERLQEDPAGWLVEVFRLMCENPQKSRGVLKPANSPAYFGGDCESPKTGHGAPIILQCLEEDLKRRSLHGSADQLHLWM